MTRLRRLSIVVPTKNEAANIGRLLASIPDEPELIICDSSDDTTATIVRRRRPDRTRLLTVGGTIAQARQIGAEASSGDILLFTDADVTFGPRYFSRLLRDRRWDGQYGVKLSGDAFAAYYRTVALAQGLVHRLAGIAGASGSNMAIRRDVFDRLGGFRTDLPCNEDSELFFRAHRSGFDVRFSPDLVVLAHDHRRLRRGFVQKSIHSVSRNLVLFATCQRPATIRLLRRDWGYWSS